MHCFFYVEKCRCADKILTIFLGINKKCFIFAANIRILCFTKKDLRLSWVSFAITVIIALIAHYCIDIEWLKLFGALVAFVFLIAILQFFRNPKRLTPKNDAHIIAPVDGKVVVIEEVFEKSISKINACRYPSLCRLSMYT